MPFLIDGYNLLRWLEAQDGGDAWSDAAMCRQIGQFLLAVGQRGEVIFDGVGPPDKRELMGVKGVSIRFSGASRDADTVIEQKIAASTAKRRLHIVSSDRRVRAAAERAKAISIPVDVFWQGLRDLLAQKAKAVREPAGKRQGISQSETELWMRLFGLRQ